jgi:hypothetical protein
MRRRRQYDHLEDGNDVIPPGGRVHVRLDMCDSMQRRVLTQRTIADALRKDAAIFSGRRPMPVRDMQFAVRMPVRDAAALVGLAAERDRAFAELEERSRNAWRLGDAVQPKPALNALPEPNWDQRDPDDDDGDDDDGNGNGNGDPLEAARAARDQALAETYKPLYQQAWNASNNLSGVTGGVLNPRAADPIEARYERMINQQPWQRGGR